MSFLAPLTLSAVLLAAPALAAKLLVSHFSGPVYTLDFTLTGATSGTLDITSVTNGTCGAIPTWLYVEKQTGSVFCFDESWYGSGVLTRYSADPDTGVLTVAEQAPTTGNSVYGRTYGGTHGRSFVITAEYSPSTISTYALPLSASTKPLQTLEFTMAAPGPRPDRQDKPHPHATFTDPTGDFMIVPDLGADLTRIFKVNQHTGFLTACPAASSLPGDGPRHGVFRRFAGGEHKYYSLNEVASSVGVYNVTYPPAHSDGCLSLDLVQTLSTYGDRAGLTTEKAAELRIAGHFLYASNRNDQTFGPEQDSLAVFTIDEVTGHLEFLELTNSYGYYPRPFQINKDGTLVAIGGQTTSDVAILARNRRTGALGPEIARIDIAPRGTYGGEDGLSSVVWFE